VPFPLLRPNHARVQKITRPYPLLGLHISSYIHGLSSLKAADRKARPVPPMLNLYAPSEGAQVTPLE